MGRGSTNGVSVGEAKALARADDANWNGSKSPKFAPINILPAAVLVLKNCRLFKIVTAFLSL